MVDLAILGPDIDESDFAVEAGGEEDGVFALVELDGLDLVVVNVCVGVESG